MDESKVEKQPVFGTFVGEINQATARGLTNSLTLATQHAESLHLILQSTGGTVAEGVYLYNFIRALTIPVAIYNVGSVCSAAVMAFLAAPIRVASRHSSFMIHRCHTTMQAANPGQVAAAAESLAIDDVRTDNILKEHLTLSPQQWEQYDRHTLWIAASDAVDCGLATEIGEFAAPMGAPIYSFGN